MKNFAIINLLTLLLFGCGENSSSNLVISGVSIREDQRTAMVTALKENNIPHDVTKNQSGGYVISWDENDGERGWKVIKQVMAENDW